MEAVGIVVGIMAAVFAIGGLFVGGVWHISSSITSSANSLRIEIKSDMKELRDELKGDLNDVEERLS